MFSRIKEELDKGIFPPWLMLRKNLQAAVAFLKVAIRHPYRLGKDAISAFIPRLKAMKAPWAPLYEEQTHYVTAADVAQVTKEDIKRATHKAKYLRPTRLCKVNDPEIVALAKKLGAWEKSNLDYAEAIFDFMRQIKFDFGPLKSANEVLHTNRGVCLDQQSLAIALARAAGIPARYSLTGLVFAPQVEDALTVDSTFKDVYNALGVWEQHGAAEL